MFNSLYGNYRQITFANAFPTVDSFKNEYNECQIPKTLKEENINTLYYLLYAYYGNSTIASSDTNRFKYNLFGIIFMYGPTWEKRLELQDKLRLLTDEDLQRGSKAIYNKSFNPSEAPSTNTLEELTTINEQNATNYKRSKIDAYNLLLETLRTDVTKSFIDKFSSLFLKVLTPELPLWYVTEKENDLENDIL